MNRLMKLAILAFVSLVLVACGSAQPVDGTNADADPRQMPGGGGQTAGSDLSWMMGQSREDIQGSVTVRVTAQNVNADADTIEFDVLLDTHSIELDMDLAPLSTLTSDTGVSVNGMLWNAPLGGHHVEGILSFPASVDGTSMLEGATRLTLTIRDVDAAERVFSWQQ